MVLEEIGQIALSALAPMVPLLLASLGEIFGERSGVVNVGVEGIMLISALVSGIAAYATGSPWAGLLAGAAAGLLMGLLHGLLSVLLAAHQVVVGIGINIASLGAVALGLNAVWGSYGVSPPLPQVPRIGVPGFYVSPLVPLSVALALILWLVLFRSWIGIVVRACGEDPRAAEGMGINVARVRIASAALGGMFMGIGGASIVVDWVGGLTREVVGGRGFIALANVVFSGWNPAPAILGAYAFGFLDALATHLSIAVSPQASYAFKTMPYVGTLALSAISIRWIRGRMPRALGAAHTRE